MTTQRFIYGVKNDCGQRFFSSLKGVCDYLVRDCLNVRTFIITDSGEEIEVSLNANILRRDIIDNKAKNQAALIRTKEMWMPGFEVEQDNYISKIELY